MAASQPDRPVIFFFGGADSIQFRASREMFMALSSVPRTWREVLNDKDNGLVTRSETLRQHLARVREFAADLDAIDPSEDRAQVDRIVKIIETDMSLNQDELFRLRMLRPDERTPESAAELEKFEARQIDLSYLKNHFQQDP